MKKLDDFLFGLRKIMDDRGLKDAPLSEKAGLGTSFIRDLFRSKAASPKLSTALLIADALNLTIEEIIAAADSNRGGVDSIAVAGKVGAGSVVPLEDVYPKGDGLYLVECPPQLSPHNVVAVEVDGDSMEPAYESGDVLFYQRDVVGIPVEAIGRRCIVEDEDGNVWVKLLRRRDGQPEGLFDLVSFHADAPPKYDVVVKWAAAIKMHLQKDLVRRVR